MLKRLIGKKAKIEFLQKQTTTVWILAVVTTVVRLLMLLPVIITAGSAASIIVIIISLAYIILVNYGIIKGYTNAISLAGIQGFGAIYQQLVNGYLAGPLGTVLIVVSIVAIILFIVLHQKLRFE